MKDINANILLIVLVILTDSCVGVNSDSDTRAVKQLSIPLDSMECIGPDSMNAEFRYTVLVYMNVDMCMECSMKQISMFDSFVQERGFHMLVLLSVSHENTKHLKYLLRSLRTEQTLSIDTTSVFLRQNPMLDEYDTQVFLLDKDNIVLIDGNPFLDDNAMKEYDRYAEN